MENCFVTTIPLHGHSTCDKVHKNPHSQTTGNGMFALPTSIITKVTILPNLKRELVVERG